MGRNDSVSNEWFPEPTERDDTYANRLESTPSWLARSTREIRSPPLYRQVYSGATSPGVGRSRDPGLHVRRAVISGADIL